MQIHVDMNFQEYRRANELMLLHTTRSRKLNYLSAIYFCPVLGTVLVLVAVATLSLPHQLRGNSVLLWAAAGGCWWVPLSYMQRVRSFYAKQRTTFKQILTLDADGINVVREDGTASSRIAWSAFESHWETPSEFLVFMPLSGFVRVPKRALSITEQEEVRSWVGSILSRSR